MLCSLISFRIRFVSVLSMNSYVWIFFRNESMDFLFLNLAIITASKCPVTS